MGGDGGSIPTRIELVKVKPKQKQEDDPFLISGVQWTQCAMSQEPLRKGEIVACFLGNLYNKSSVLEFLINKDNNYKFDHIKSLKQILTLNLKFADELKKEKDILRARLGGEKLDQKEDTVLDKAAATVNAIFVCPITSLPANGRQKFVAMKTCGCVLSEKAVKEIPSRACLVCSRMLKDGVGGSEWFTVNPPVAEQEQMRKDLAAKDDKPKKSKKRKVNSEHAGKSEEAASSESAETAKATDAVAAVAAVDASAVESTKKAKHKSASTESKLDDPSAGKKEKVGLWGKAIKRPERPDILQKLRLPTGEDVLKGKSSTFQSMFLSKEQVNEAPNLCSTKMASAMSLL